MRRVDRATAWAAGCFAVAGLVVLGFAVVVAAVLHACGPDGFNPAPQIRPQHARIACRSRGAVIYSGRIVNDSGPPLPYALDGTWSCTSTTFSDVTCRVVAAER